MSEKEKLPPSIPDNFVKLWRMSSKYEDDWYAELDNGNYAWVDSEGCAVWYGEPKPEGAQVETSGLPEDVLNASPIWTIEDSLKTSTQAQCTCDLYYFMNNGCPSTHGLPCVNGRWARY